MAIRPIIKMGIYDTTAKKEATYDNMINILDISNIQNTLKDINDTTEIASLELNSWLLSGNLDVMPVDNPPIISKYLSDDEGSFNPGEEMQFDIKFANPHTSVGLTLFWSEEAMIHPTQIEVTWWGEAENEILVKETFSFEPDGTRAETFVDKFVESYFAITVKILKINRPYTRVRFTKINFGLEYIFESHELKSGNIIKEISPISEVVTVGQLNFEALPSKRKFNSMSDDSIFSALQVGQQLEVFDQENLDSNISGIYYLESWEARNLNIISFKCVDIIGLLNKENSLGNLYENKLISDILNEEFDVPIRLSDEVSDEPLTGWIPPLSKREVLQQICFATNTFVFVSDDSTIILRRPGNIPKTTIDMDRKFLGAIITQRPKYTNVGLSSYTFTRSDEEVEITRSILPEGEHTIMLSEPMYNYSAENATIIASGVNYVKVKAEDASTDVIVKGFTYLQEKKILETYSNIALPGGNRTYLSSEGCTLISQSNADYICKEIYEYYDLNRHISFRTILNDEHIGDVIRVRADETTYIEGPITKIDTNLVSSISSVEVLGSIYDMSKGDPLQRLKTFNLRERVVL